MSTKDKTLNQLENDDWGEAPPEERSYIVKAILGLRRKPLRDMDVEDLRMAIGQDIGLPYLMPLAIEELRRDPLAKGMHYPGDLLCNVLKVTPKFFRDNPEIRRQVERVLDSAITVIQSLDADKRKLVEEAIEEAAANFRRQA